MLPTHPRRGRLGRIRIPVLQGVSMPTRNVNLTESFDDFVSDQIEAGHFRNASEVVRAGLRLLQQQAAEDSEKLVALKRLAKVGLDQLDQGRGIEFRSVSSLAKHVESLGSISPKRRGRRGA